MAKVVHIVCTKNEIMHKRDTACPSFSAELLASQFTVNMILDFLSVKHWNFSSRYVQY